MNEEVGEASVINHSPFHNTGKLYLNRKCRFKLNELKESGGGWWPRQRRGMCAGQGWQRKVNNESIGDWRMRVKWELSGSLMIAWQRYGWQVSYPERRKNVAMFGCHHQRRVYLATRSVVNHPKMPLNILINGKRRITAPRVASCVTSKRRIEKGISGWNVWLAATPKGDQWRDGWTVVEWDLYTTLSMFKNIKLNSSCT